MNTDKRTETLQQVVADALERFAFSFVEDEEPQYHDAAWLLSDIAFTGPFRGKVHFAVCRELAFDLGVNILGVEPEAAPPDLAEDALKELTNIICGDLLYRLYGPREVFDLRVPALRTAVSFQAVKREIPPDAAVVELTMEGHRLISWLTVEARQD